MEAMSDLSASSMLTLDTSLDSTLSPPPTPAPPSPRSASPAAAATRSNRTPPKVPPPPRAPPKASKRPPVEHRRMVECGLCLTISRDNVIYACPEGHNICYDCWARIKKKRCPQTDCKLPFDNPPRRNKTAEELVLNSDFRFPCKHRCGHDAPLTALREHERNCVERCVACDECGEVVKASLLRLHLDDFHLPCVHSFRGCRRKGRRRDVGAHQLVCSFRDVPCPGTCQQTMQFSEVMKHFNNNHPSAQKLWHASGFFQTSWPIRQGVGDQTSHPHVLNFNREVFFLNQRVKDGFFFAWVTMWANHDDAKNRWAKIKMRNPYQSHGIRGKVYCIEKKVDINSAIETSGGAMMRLRMDQVVDCLDNDYRLNLVVSIEFEPSEAPKFLQATVQRVTNFVAEKLKL